MHKRKHRKSNRDDHWDPSARQTGHSQSTKFSSERVDASVPDPCLYIQGHEADIIRGSHALSARSLEYQDQSVTNSGSGLIRWGLERPYDTDSTINAHESNGPWVDRYDVRLLLDRLPDVQETLQPRPLSPSGWTDLPSDSEDTFFFSPDELEDYHREKRRRLIDRGREERLRALAAIDNQDDDPDPWGGSDEEPDEAQRELIRRTASHIISSPNPGQLEMRILANHGTDKRFAFLRGRWTRVWRTEMEKAKQRQIEEAKEIHPPTPLKSLGGLAGYGDSDTDDGEPAGEPDDAAANLGTLGGSSNEDDIKGARRARAREWSARRRAATEQQSEPILAQTHDS